MTRFLIVALSLLLVAAPALAAPKGGRAKPKTPSSGSVRTPKKKVPDVKLKAQPPTGEGQGATAATSAQQGGTPQRGPTRIDFDDRLIQGQTNKSGAVYLYDRKELKQRSMVKTRESFREEIVSTVYDK